MKKAIAILIVFLGLTFSANAQSQDPKAKNFDVPAQNDLKLLGQKVTLSDTEQKELLELFAYKHREIANIKGSAERTRILSDVMIKKILTTLSEENANIMKNEEDLLKKLSI